MKKSESAQQEFRSLVSDARCVVIKIGTRVLVNKSGRPEHSRIEALVKEIARIKKSGRDVAVVSSGAIGAGVEALGLKKRPTSLPDLQMAASVGQGRLMATYGELFRKEKLKVGQMLLTHDDLKERERHLNVRNTINKLLSHDVIPIINENDVVSTDAIKIGDNDQLASLVSLLIGAEVLVLLTTTDGLRAPTPSGRTKRVSYVQSVTDETLKLANGKGSELSIGGMSAKLRAAQTVVKAGGMVVIADGRKPENLGRVLGGEDVGTLLGAPKSEDMQIIHDRKRWIAFFQKVRGSLVVDDGAGDALEQKQGSLLPIGVKEVQGKFQIGSLVNVKNGQGRLLARGLVEYSSQEIEIIKGHKTSEIESLLGSKDFDEIIHRDNLVVFGTRDGEVT